MWEGSSDHTLIMHNIKDRNMKKARKMVSKKILTNKCNKEEVAEHYAQLLEEIASNIRSKNLERAQDVFELARDVIAEPWERIARRRSNTKTPHWNFHLNSRWRDMRKARMRANKSGLRIDMDTYEEKRRRFLKEKRRAKRRLKSRTEALLRKGSGNAMAEAIRRERKRREEQQKESALNSSELNPTEFTEFMGTFHDQNQKILDLEQFTGVGGMVGLGI